MALDYDLEYGLRLKSSAELQHKSLYDSAIVEVEAGNDIGPDYIGWGWTQSFTGFELAVSDSLTMDDKNGIGNDLASREIRHSYGVHAKLKPGHPRQHRWEDTTYRLFGTARVLTEITLDIRPVSDPAEEGCTAWASASYMSEVDFRNVAQPDCLCFYMLVSQTVYDRYLWNIAQGLVNEVVFSVGFVDGFYADWNPGISTREIKVLAGEEHSVAGAEGRQLSRIGKVSKVELGMNAVGLIRSRSSAPAEEAVTEERRAEPEQRPAFRWPGRR